MGESLGSELWAHRPARNEAVSNLLGTFPILIWQPDRQEVRYKLREGKAWAQITQICCQGQEKQRQAGRLKGVRKRPGCHFLGQFPHVKLRVALSRPPDFWSRKESRQALKLPSSCVDGAARLRGLGQSPGPTPLASWGKEPEGSEWTECL